MSTREFFTARAEACAKDAAESVLDNVRDRNLRAQAAWTEMADRIGRADVSRARQADEKATRLLED